MKGRQTELVFGGRVAGSDLQPGKQFVGEAAVFRVVRQGDFLDV